MTDQFGAIIEVNVGVQSLPELHREEDVGRPGPLGRIMVLPLPTVGEQGGVGCLCRGCLCRETLGGCHRGWGGGDFLLQSLLVLCLLNGIPVWKDQRSELRFVTGTYGWVSIWGQIDRAKPVLTLLLTAT